MTEARSQWAGDGTRHGGNGGLRAGLHGLPPYQERFIVETGRVGTMQVRSSIKSGILLVWGSVCLMGCISSGHRNFRESILVLSSPSLEESEVRFSLELRDSRKELTLASIDDFLASDDAFNVSRSMRRQVRERAHRVRSTIADAQKQLRHGPAIVRPDPKNPYANNNVIAYVRTHQGIRVLFSYAEIDRLLAFHELADDLRTIRYTTPGVDPVQLCALRDEAAVLNLAIKNLSPSPRHVERLKNEAATRILERTLRAQGVALSAAELLTSSPFGAARSPKLNKAFEDRHVLESLIQSGDPNAVRALVYLAGRGIVDMDQL